MDLQPSSLTRNLPYELIEHIFKFALVDSRHFASQLCSVSSWAQSIASPALLHTVTFHSEGDKDHPRHFPYAVNAKVPFSSQHSSLVRRLCTLGRYRISYAGFLPGIMAACPNLTELAIYLPEFTHAVLQTTIWPNSGQAVLMPSRKLRLLVEVPEDRDIVSDLTFYEVTTFFIAPPERRKMSPVFAMVTHIHLDARRFDEKALLSIMRIFESLTHFALPIEALSSPLEVVLPERLEMLVMTVAANSELHGEREIYFMKTKNKDKRAFLYFHHSGPLEEWRQMADTDSSSTVWSQARNHTKQWMDRQY